MLIRVRELELRNLEFEERLSARRHRVWARFYPGRPVAQRTGRAELIVEHRGHHQDVEDIRLVGKVETNLEFSCARCLEPVGHDVNWAFDLIYRPLGVDRRADEVGDHAKPTPRSAITRAKVLLLEDALREQVLLATPVRALCREDCKGLCPHCGCNLNVEQCHCEQHLSDPRWEALNEIKKKLQS